MVSSKLGRRLAWLGGALFLLLIVLGVPSAQAGPRQQGTGVAAQVDRILANMTLRQRVAQMFMVSLWGEALTQGSTTFLADYAPGSIALFGYNVGDAASLTRLTNAIQQTIMESGAERPAAWIAIDHEGGVVNRLTDEFTTFPVAMTITAANDPALARAIGQAMAGELRAVGINMDLAPVADLETNPNNPIIARRSFGADPELVATVIAEVIGGLQQGGVLATAKHFPGHGETSEDSHLSLPEVDLDRNRLETMELVPFRRAIQSSVGAIMVAHIWFPALDSVPGTPASLSPAIVTGLLRDEMGFNGMILTDALDMDAIDTRYSLSQAALLAVQAGADVVVPGPHVSLEAQQEAIEAVAAAVEAGEIPSERIDDSVRRILTLKAQYGLLNWEPLDPATALQRINRAAHEATVAQLLASSITLVYDTQNFVPVDTAREVALIYPATRPSIARECQAYDADVRLIGVSASPTDEEIAWAVTAANHAEIAIVFTQDAGADSTQQRLVNALPPEKTVAVALRSPYDWQVYPEVAAYLAAYSPLQPVIPAACAALFGAQPITGVLPIRLSDALPAGTSVQRP